MPCEVCFDIPAEQGGEFLAQLGPSSGLHRPTASVIEHVCRCPVIEHVRHEALVEGRSHNADDGLGVGKTVLPTELRDDTSRNDRCLFARQFSNGIAAIPASYRGVVFNDLSDEAEVLESGDHGGRHRSIDKIDAQQRSMTINFCPTNTGRFFQMRQHGRKSGASAEARRRASG